MLIRNEVISNEKSNAINDLEFKYRPNQFSENIKTINNVIANRNNSLDSTINYIKADNILILDSFFIHLSDTLVESHVPDNLKICIALYNKSGHLLNKFYGLKTQDNNSLKLREFLLFYKNYYLTQTNLYFKQKKDIISEGRIWTFRRIWPYCINFFISDNFKPISALANLFFSIHHLIVFVLLSSIIPTLINDRLKTYKTK